MKAKKVSIFLALVAISVVTLFVISLVDGDALGAELSQNFGPGKNIFVVNQDVLSKAGPRDFLPAFVFQEAHGFQILPGPASFAPAGGVTNDRKAE